MHKGNVLVFHSLIKSIILIFAAFFDINTCKIQNDAR